MVFDKTISMFIFDGNPSGRIMAELSNWNGRVYKISRKELHLFGERPDSQNTGVYLLFGNDIEKGDTVYIGEAEKVFDRLKQHLRGNEYWNECMVLISKDDLLNKAHVKYMENKLYLLATEADRYEVLNSSIPTCSSISEYDEATLNEFIENAKLLVSTLGKKVFETPVERPRQQTEEESIFYIKAARGADGYGTMTQDGFAVFKGSVIADSTSPSMASSLVNLRENLIKENIIDENYMFTKDHLFTSPSLAAATVLGRNANGRTEWKRSDGKCINDLESLI